MQKKNVMVLKNKKGDYVYFLNLLGDHFPGLEIYYETGDIIRGIGSGCDEDSLLILFVEYPYLDSLYEYLNKNISSSGYILISFYDHYVKTGSKYAYLFDFINTNSYEFDNGFFFTRLEAEIKNRAWLSILQFELGEFYEIGKSLSVEKDTIKLLEMIINSSISLTSSDAGTIYLIIDRETGSWSSLKNNQYNTKLMKYAIAKNASMDIKLEAVTVPIMRQSISGYSAITGETVRIDDAYKIDQAMEYRHDQKNDMKSGYRTKSVLSVPMKDHEDNVLGVIQLINKKKVKTDRLAFTKESALDSIIPYDFTDEMLMNSLAGQAAIALENNLLYRDMHNLLQDYKEQNKQLELLSKHVLKAHEEERKRIAREIHDGPAQSVVNLSLKLELCKKYLQLGSYEKVNTELGNLNTSVRSTAKEIRTIIYDLKPSFLEDGLLKALENHFNIFRENTGIRIIFTSSTGDLQTEYYMASTIYRIVQEALTNINKHAHASMVEVDFNINDGNIKLLISDNGVGFDIAKVRSEKQGKIEGGFGLDGIRERVELIGGKVDILSSPGKGTHIAISIPLHE